MESTKNKIEGSEKWHMNDVKKDQIWSKESMSMKAVVEENNQAQIKKDHMNDVQMVEKKVDHRNHTKITTGDGKEKKRSMKGLKNEDEGLGSTTVNIGLFRILNFNKDYSSILTKANKSISQPRPI